MSEGRLQSGLLGDTRCNGCCGNSTRIVGSTGHLLSPHFFVKTPHRKPILPIFASAQPDLYGCRAIGSQAMEGAVLSDNGVRPRIRHAIRSEGSWHGRCQSGVFPFAMILPVSLRETVGRQGAFPPPECLYSTGVIREGRFCGRQHSKVSMFCRSSSIMQVERPDRYDPKLGCKRPQDAGDFGGIRQ